MSTLPRSVYLHVPFCTRRCAYCDFAVQATRDAPTAEWLDAIGAEWQALGEEQGWPATVELDTIYVGGGTPSLLGPDAMAGVARALGTLARWDPGAVEWSCEANPESFTPAVAEGWRAAGVNRLSLGAQSFHEPALRWMGRLHGAQGPAAAMETARAAGFRNVSIDLIFALPARLGRDWSADLDRALALEPEHISLYGLTAESGTPLGRWVREGRERMADEDNYAEEYLLAHERLTAAGFEHYEVSNFARPGLRSRHNFAYWTGVPYAALGPGAHAYLPPQRRWNVRGWEDYRDALRRGDLPVEGTEALDPADRALEELWLGLRTDLGLALTGLGVEQRAMARGWVGRGWAEDVAGRLRLNAEGWLLLDRLAVELHAAGEVAAAGAAD